MSDILPEQSGALEQEIDAGKGASGVVKRWKMEIQIASKEEEHWRKDAARAWKRYRGEGKPRDGNTKFNILHSNTQILNSAIYNSTPIPEVRRRFRDDDEVGEMVSEVLQRALNIVMEDGGFDDAMDDANLDHLLPGRGIVRARWMPVMTTRKVRTPANMQITVGDNGEQIPTQPEGSSIDDDGQPFFEGSEEEDVKEFEEIEFEYVHWDSFRHGPGRRWKDVTWIAFEHLMTKDEIVEQFGKQKAKLVKMDVEVKERTDGDGDSGGDHPPDVFKRGRVWEIWDKVDRKVMFMAPSHAAGLLDEQEDPLGLKDFFPTPKPLYSIKTDSLVPLPEYLEYEQLADELDLISHRIQRIISGMKLRGVYDSSMGEFDQIFDSDDNGMIPSRDGGAAMQNGGLDRAVWFMPVDKFGAVLAQLYQDRVILRDTIFEVTGISDIIRGASRASETATAQNIKAKFGGMRLDKRVRAVAVYARDLLNIAAEIMAENFDPETLHAMTGREITPEMTELMQDDFMRRFRVDIETDSTISASEHGDQQEMTRLMAAVGGYIQGVAPLVQQGMFPMEAAKAILLAIVRKFKFGRELEGALEQLGTQQQKQNDGPTPEESAQQAEGQKAQAEMQLQQQSDQASLQLEQQKMQSDQALEQQKAQAELALEQAESNAKIELEREKMQQELSLEREKMHLDAETKIQVAQIMANVKEVQTEEEFM